MVVRVKNIFFTHRNGGYHEKEFYAERLQVRQSVWQSVPQLQFSLHSYTVTEIIIRSSQHWWSSVEMKLMRSWRR